MPRTRVKICGVTRPADAAHAAQAGADAIGIVLYPNTPRAVSIDTARAILNILPPFVTAVALFVDQPLADVRRIASDLGLGHIQLHGHESREFVAALSPLRVLKAIPVRRDSLPADLAAWQNPPPNLAGLVLDSHSPQAGGAGVLNDFDAIAKLTAQGGFTGLPPIVAAGGLNPSNVASVIQRLRPWAVDVSSGVESEKGIKSAALVEQFVAAVRAADAALAK